MAEWRLTAGSRADLRDIWAYSYDQWGEARASSYLSELEERFERLARLPFRDWGDIRPGLRSSRAERHVVFWQFDAEGVPAIAAILHERMNFLDHLKQRMGPTPE
ncbi:type II toxin-antitoxin system RelE/ParE family toxin [Oceanicola sp. D3]|uniref:type II toxin-antitoxin system RelE/ParE family toxin n=1 Tax=Oceanicola sp. D3 TaxID=2587163 RepID=UPI00111DC9EB|nr:type II toxin-antitoxin system RelE/ParE family toxin [Oceanicola sp. D3]QDC07770.1 type II toxin-antitoxin system RelE/ParE family toxin [Oceanicola sp. D3]